MGLGIYLKDDPIWRSSYSRFGAFRDEVARVAGVGSWRETANPDDAVIEGLWNAGVHNALDVLLNHSDCDGVILPYNASLLAERLEELFPDLGDEWKIEARTFINGLNEAAENKQILEFF